MILCLFLLLFEYFLDCFLILKPKLTYNIINGVKYSKLKFFIIEKDHKQYKLPIILTLFTKK